MGLSGINAVFARAVWHHQKALSAYKTVLPFVPDQQAKHVIEGIVQGAQRDLDALNSALSAVSPENEQGKPDERFLEKDLLDIVSLGEPEAADGEQEAASEQDEPVNTESVTSAEEEVTAIAAGLEEQATQDAAPLEEKSDPDQSFLESDEDLPGSSTPSDTSLEEQEPETVVPVESREPGEVLAEIALQQDEITSEGKPKVIVWKGF
ncbi:MAG: hypothetical protein ACYDDN_01945 [Candidatus Desulforudaceae bacterium]|jgi:hypothetical protein